MSDKKCQACVELSLIGNFVKFVNFTKGSSFGSLVNSGCCPKKPTAKTGDFLSRKKKERKTRMAKVAKFCHQAT